MDLSIKQKDVKEMDLEELPSFENLFEVYINIFRLNEENVHISRHVSSLTPTDNRRQRSEGAWELG